MTDYDSRALTLNLDTAASFARSHGGWAATPAALAEAHAWLPNQPECAWLSPDLDLRQWPSADVTWWEPPSPVAFDPDTCDTAVTAVTDWTDPIEHTHPAWNRPWRCATWRLDHDSDPADLAPDVRAVASQALTAGWIANAAWWRLDLNEWTVEVKRYEPGQAHPRHADLHVGQLTRKLAVLVQLSDPDDYEGGDLRVHPSMSFDAPPLKPPRTRGTVAVFPGWIHHQVTPVTTGVRWSLVAWGLGPAIR